MRQYVIGFLFGVIATAVLVACSGKKTPIDLAAAGEAEEWQLELSSANDLTTPKSCKTRGRPEFLPGVVHFTDDATGKEWYARTDKQFIWAKRNK